jgi:hypothetical protein
MKLLLTIIMSTVVSASAFGACSLDSVKDCSTKESCEGLSKADGVKFVFNGDNKKCMVQESAGATNCLEVSDSMMGKGTQSGTAAGSEGKATSSK